LYIWFNKKIIQLDSENFLFWKFCYFS